MFEKFDEETKTYALWDLLLDPAALNYTLNAILTQPVT
jgi:hypothetical protein